VKKFHEIHLPNSISAISELNDCIENLAELWNIGQKPLFDLTLAVEELVSNTINYGYRDGNEHIIDITVELHDDVVTITIADDGIQFNPFDAETPNVDDPPEKRKIGGLGIHLVRNLMDSVSYEHRDGKNVITIKKSIR